LGLNSKQNSDLNHPFDPTSKSHNGWPYSNFNPYMDPKQYQDWQNSGSKN